MMAMSHSDVCDDGGGCTDASLARREAIIRVARTLFFEKGYAGTPMNAIAAAVGGSKTTLWSYFPSKEELFKAVIDDMAEQYSEALKIDLPADGDMAIELRRFALALVRTLSNEHVIALQRLVIGEAERFPELSHAFYERAPKQGRVILTTFFLSAMERGVMRRGDPRQAANHFKALVGAHIPQLLLFNWPVDHSLAAIEADADAAVDAFMRIWRAD